MSLGPYVDPVPWVAAGVAAVVLDLVLRSLSIVSRRVPWTVTSVLGNIGMRIASAKKDPVSASAFTGFQVGALVALLSAGAVLGAAATLAWSKGVPAIPWIFVLGTLTGLCAISAAWRVAMLALFFREANP